MAADDYPARTGLEAVVAARAALDELGFTERARRTQCLLEGSATQKSAAGKSQNVPKTFMV